MQVKYKVKQSKIPGGGKGLFAAEFIPKGTIVWKYKDENHILFKNEKELTNYLTKFKTENEKREFLFRVYRIKCPIKEFWVAYQKDDSHYFNHSDNPNTGYSAVESLNNDNTYCYSVALRDIKKGEELTDNYCEHEDDEWYIKLQQKYNLWMPVCRLKSKL